MEIIPVRTHDVLNSFKAKLVADDILPAASIYFTLDPDRHQVKVNSTYVAITPGKHDGNTPESYEVTTIQGPIYVTIWLFSGLDQGQQADKQLTDLTYGIYPYVTDIGSSLHLQMLEDSTHAFWIVTKPIQLRSMEQPEQIGKWIKCKMEFNVKYLLNTVFGGDRARSSAFSSAFG